MQPYCIVIEALLYEILPTIFCASYHIHNSRNRDDSDNKYACDDRVDSAAPFNYFQREGRWGLGCVRTGLQQLKIVSDAETQFNVDPALIEADRKLSARWHQVEGYWVAQYCREIPDSEDRPLGCINAGHDIEAEQGQHREFSLFDQNSPGVQLDPSEDEQADT